MEILQEKGPDVPKIAMALVEEYKAENSCSAQDINNGMCEGWAMRLIRELEGITDAYGMGDIDLLDWAKSWPESRSDDFLQTKHGRWSKSELEQFGFPPTVDINEVTSLPSHAWAVVGDRHYDAEAPQGVAHWYELPIFKKFFDLLRR